MKRIQKVVVKFSHNEARQVENGDAYVAWTIHIDVRVRVLCNNRVFVQDESIYKVGFGDCFEHLFGVRNECKGGPVLKLFHRFA